MAAYLSKPVAANHRQIAATALRERPADPGISLFSSIPTYPLMLALEMRWFHSKSVAK
jgi:hypothetical protein